MHHCGIDLYGFKKHPLTQAFSDPADAPADVL